MNISDNIRKIRLCKNYSQQGMADLLGKSRSWLCKMEAGEIDPKLSTLKQIATMCGVSITVLLSEKIEIQSIKFRQHEQSITN